MIFQADPEEDFTVTHESKDIKWVPLDEVKNYNDQPAFLRLVKKAKNVGTLLN